MTEDSLREPLLDSLSEISGGLYVRDIRVMVMVKHQGISILCTRNENGWCGGVLRAGAAPVTAVRSKLTECIQALQQEIDRV